MKTSSILAPILVAALAAPAIAQPTPEPTPAPASSLPAGPPFDTPAWQPDETHGRVMLRDLMAPFPENVHADARVWSLHPPGGGGAMIGSVLLIGVTGEGKDFVRARLDELRRTPEIVAGSDPSAKVRTISWQEKVDDAQKLVDAHLEWAQDDHGTISIVRAVWIRPTSPSDAVEEYRVECVMATDAVAAMRPACEQAMASLRPRALAERQAIAVAAAVAAEPADDADGDDAATPGEAPSMRETPSTIGPVLASRPPQREQATDMRPFYVGGFILLVVAVLWWNRKKRAELDAEEGRDAGDPDAPPVDEPADADAEDLAEAAKKEPE